MNCLSTSAVAVTTALLLAACGGTTTSGAEGSANSSAPAHGSGSAPHASSASPTTAAADHNEQDVAFARDMIVHHASAIEMAKLAEQRASNAQVKNLAQRIEQAQAPEIETMSGWLRSWNQPVPDVNAAMSGGGHGGGHGGSMGGMDPADMAKLTAAKGAEFDRMFLEMMTEHHQGAVDMAKTEQAKGKYVSAQQLAAEIVRSQTAEIEEMRGLLAKQ